MRKLGYADQAGTRFSLATGALRLGYGLIASVPLRDLAIPYMVSLVDQVRESCVLSLLDGLDVIEVANVPFERNAPIALALRSRFPAQVTPAGRLLIASLPLPERRLVLDRLDPLEAFTSRTIRSRRLLERALDEAREQGWALVDEEFEDGIRSIAAPIRDGDDRVVAAISVWSYSSKVSVHRFRHEILPHVRETASLITSAMVRGR
jgi:IclR family transcriptional regulator, pca regulon regulatory protein